MRWHLKPKNQALRLYNHRWQRRYGEGK